MPLILILILAVFQCSITNYLIMNPDYYQLGPYTWESSEFRAMKLGDGICRWDSLDFDKLTTLMIEHDYDLTKVEDMKYNNSLLLAARPSDYRKLKHAYETVLGDLVYFPVPASSVKTTPDTMFENGWMEGRSYVKDGDGGAKGREGEGRKHEGCDIMGNKLPRGSYPVVSVSGGGSGEGGMAGDGRMAHWNTDAKRSLSVLCPFVRLCQGVEGGGRCEGRRAFGVYGRFGIWKDGGYGRKL